MKKIALFLLPVLLVACNASEDNVFDLNFKLIPVKVGDNWGYISRDGKFAINPQFKKAFTFREGRALIKSADDKYGYIDESGKIIITPQYKYASVFSEGLAAVAKEDQTIEFIDKTGKTAFFLDQTMETADPFFEGLARIQVNGKYGYINKEGKIAISPQYTDAGMFLDGLASVETKEGDKAKEGYIDKNGKIVIAPQFDMAGDFFDDRARIKIDTSYGFIDKQGKIVIAPQYSQGYDFNQNCAAVEQGDLWGFIDNNGKMTINFQFKNVYPFTSSGLAIVESASNEKWGVIDKNGKFVVNPQYDEIDGFYDHAAIAKQNGKYGLIDDKGQILVNPIYSDVEPYPLSVFGNEVHNDFFNISDISDIIYKDMTPASARGINRNTSFADLQQKFPGLTHDNSYNFTPADDGNSALQLSSIAVIPANGFITYGNEQAGSPYGDTTKVYHDDLPVVAVIYTYTLKNKAYDKADHIIQLLKDKKPGGFTQEIINEHALVLYGTGYNVAVKIKEGNLYFGIYAGEANFDDVKKSLSEP
ncbi:MAG TPA: WG repeat-containing protein [Chitinophagaceae bacterium]|nr:WG repeat-containing protein [Chitinophagaceae bacterium]